jgi:hypothetical protein
VAEGSNKNTKIYNFEFSCFAFKNNVDLSKIPVLGSKLGCKMVKNVLKIFFGKNVTELIFSV